MDMQGFNTGSIAASIVAAVLLTTATVLLAHTKKLAVFVARRRILSKIKTKYLLGFRIQSSPCRLWKPTLYYFRDEQTFLRSKFGAPLDFLKDSAVELLEFKAFLILPLDRTGQSEVDRSASNAPLHAEIDQRWKDYFDAMGDKAEIAASRENRAVAQRIVFFDKSLLDYVLLDTDNAIRESGISMDGQLTIPTDVSPTRKAAQYSIRMAYHLLTIHGFNLAYKKYVETIYMDKSIVRSNQYYDFGLFNFSGAKLVYMPHYLKSTTKIMVGDQVILSENRSQLELINEFERDFQDVLKRCSPHLKEETRLRSNSIHISTARKYLRAYTAEFFGQIYYEPLLKVFINRLKWKPR
jgi:hypothetical protein